MHEGTADRDVMEVTKGSSPIASSATDHALRLPSPETARDGDPPCFSGESQFRTPCGAGSLAVGNAAAACSDFKDARISG